MMFLDIDECICIRGSSDIATFIDTMPPETNTVYFNWSRFGNNGHRTRTGGSVLLTYTRHGRSLSPFTKLIERAGGCHTSSCS